MFCHHCGTQVPNDVQFCPTWGQSLNAAPAALDTPSYVAPVGLKASAGRWVRSGCAMVKADMGYYPILCLIPGLVVGAMYKFTYLFIADKRMDFWPAMQASHAVVRNDYFGFTMFLLLMVLVNILGALCCIVGLVISIPVTFAAITVAYQ